MSVHGAVLLAGLFAVPGGLLWLGHGLRRRGPRSRRIFWGGVVGHALGMIVMLIAGVTPPVFWGADAARSLVVYGGLALGAVLGGLWGALPRESGRPS